MKNPHSKKPTSLRSGQAAQLSTLALGVSALLLSPSVAAEEEVMELDTLEIEDRTIDTNPYAEKGAPYKAKYSGDQRRSRPIAETPQTMTVLTGTQIEDSGRTDLKEILQGQPGITLGTGENGNAFGDRYVIRGHEARSDVFVDGLRDPGMTTRESFATEQLEVTKGPSSTFAGRGSTGGAVNSVTKQASTEYNFTDLQLGIGTDKFHRATVDTNQVLTDTVAVRANLLHAYEEIPDRGPTDRERLGAALSASFDVSDKLKLVADYYHLQADDLPDLGTYIISGGGDPVDDIPVYAQEQDFLESTVDTFTLRAAYEFSDSFRVQNAFRYGTTDNGYVVTGARGTARDATDTLAPGVDTIRLSTHQGWQDVEYFVDQLNFYFDTEDSAGLLHKFMFGLEYSDLQVVNGVYSVTNTNATNCVTPGRGGAADNYCLLDANGEAVANANTLLGRSITRGNQDSDYNVETISLSLMDTIEVTEKVDVFLGLRYDDFDYSNEVYSGRTDTTTFYSYSDGIWNGHLGVVYDINPQGNVYFTWSTSSNINGGESDVGGSCGYGGLCGSPEQVTENKPENTVNLELGSKWNLFNQKLLATIALFQITKKDVMESIGDDDYATIGTINTGKNRVKGIEIGLTGNITEKLSTQFGLAIMDAEVLESHNEDNIGKTLSNFADDSAYLQLKYQLTDRFAFGSTVTYSSELYAGQPDTAAGFNTSINDYSYTVPSYTTLDLFASYDFTDQLSTRFNLLNATDEDFYLAAYRSGAFTYIGDARRATLSLTYQM